MRAYTRPSPLHRRIAGTVAAGLLLAVIGTGATSGAAVPSSPAAKPAVLGPMLFIGDSVGASIGWGLPRLLAAGNYVTLFDAQSGRCTIRTPNRCRRGDAWDALGKLDPSAKPKFAVVELGYNDTKKSFALGIDTLMKDLLGRGVQRVIWINLSERHPNTTAGGSLYAPYNQVLRDATRRWSQLTVLDWNAASASSNADSWFIGFSKGKTDLIHLTALGQTKFAQWIRDELDRLRGAGVLPGSVPPTTTPSTTTKPGTTKPGTVRPVLKLGSTGAAVVQLQKALVARGAAISTDGEFGPGTERAVKAFQKAAGLNPDGIVGPKTWKALGL